MRKYWVFLRGENFFLKVEEEVKRMGFYTTRFLVAADEGQTEERAVKSLREDENLRKAIVNDRSDPPLLFAEEIEELSSFDGVENPSQGLVFFEDAPTRN